MYARRRIPKPTGKTTFPQFCSKVRGTTPDHAWLIFNDTVRVGIRTNQDQDWLWTISGPIDRDPANAFTVSDAFDTKEQALRSLFDYFYQGKAVSVNRRATCPISPID